MALQRMDLRNMENQHHAVAMLVCEEHTGPIIFVANRYLFGQLEFQIFETLAPNIIKMRQNKKKLPLFALFMSNLGVTLFFFLLTIVFSAANLFFFFGKFVFRICQLFVS